MRAKSILTLVLGAFVVAAFFAVVWQSMRPSPAGPPTVRTASANAPRIAGRVEERPAAAAPPGDPATERGGVAVAPVAEQQAGTPAKDREPVSAVIATAPLPPPPASRRRIVAMYFHGDVRCATCRKVEAYAREAVEEGFAAEITSGLVEFRAVNVDRLENRHFIEDYQLTNKSVVVADEVGGAAARWVKLDNVWGLVGDRDAYLHYVQDAVRAYVED